MITRHTTASDVLLAYLLVCSVLLITTSQAQTDPQRNSITFTYPLFGNLTKEGFYSRLVSETSIVGSSFQATGTVSCKEGHCDIFFVNQENYEKLVHSIHTTFESIMEERYVSQPNRTLTIRSNNRTSSIEDKYGKVYFIVLKSANSTGDTIYEGKVRILFQNPLGDEFFERLIQLLIHLFGSVVVGMLFIVFCACVFCVCCGVILLLVCTVIAKAICCPTNNSRPYVPNQTWNQSEYYVQMNENGIAPTGPHPNNPNVPYYSNQPITSSYVSNQNNANVFYPSPETGVTLDKSSSQIESE